MIPILLEAALAALAATNWGLLEGVLVTDWVPVWDAITAGVFEAVSAGVTVGVEDPVQVAEEVSEDVPPGVLVRVSDVV